MNRFLTVAIIVLLSFSFQASAEKLTSDERTLVGIDKLKLIIESPDDKLLNAGLTTQDLRTIAELKLRLANIKITDGFPDAYLKIHVYSFETSDDYLTFTSEVAILQNSTLSRDPDIFVSLGTTWTTGSIGHWDKPSIRQAIKNNIGSKMDEFLNAYLKANPRQD